MEATCPTIGPESTRVDYTAPQGLPSRRATVQNLVFLGNCIHINAQLENGERAICEVARGQHPFTAGEAVWLHWHPADELHFE